MATACSELRTTTGAADSGDGPTSEIKTNARAAVAPTSPANGAGENKRLHHGLISAARRAARTVSSANRAPAVIVLPKHQSTWETFAFPGLMPHPLAYVFKRELLYIPFFGWAMARMDMIHIDRARRSEAWRRVAEQGARHMSHGAWVIMFPEGTRAERGSQEEYKSGGTRLAVTTGAAVLPIAVTSARCWPRKSLVLRPGTVDVSIGPLIPSTGRRPDELMREVETWIEAEMRRLDPEAYPAAAALPTAASDAPPTA